MQSELERREKHRIATLRWAKRNPEKVRANWRRYRERHPDRRRITWGKNNMKRRSTGAIKKGIERMRKSLREYEEELRRRGLEFKEEDETD